MMACTCRETILRSTNMTGVDCTSAQMPFADFNNSTLLGTNFSGTNLTGARLSGANLTNAVLNSANLQGANMQGANVSGLKFDEKTTWPDGKKGSAGAPLDYTK